MEEGPSVYYIVSVSDRGCPDLYMQYADSERKVYALFYDDAGMLCRKPVKRMQWYLTLNRFFERADEQAVEQAETVRKRETATFCATDSRSAAAASWRHNAGLRPLLW